jgi:hypothetical protein
MKTLRLIAILAMVGALGSAVAGEYRTLACVRNADSCATSRTLVRLAARLRPSLARIRKVAS